MYDRNNVDDPFGLIDSSPQESQTFKQKTVNQASIQKKITFQNNEEDNEF